MSFSFQGNNINEAKEFLSTAWDEEDKGMKLCDIVEYAIHSNNREMCQFVIDNDCNMAMNHGLTMSVEYGRRELIEMFISSGADDYDGALLAAAKNGERDLVDIFLCLGTTHSEISMAAVRASTNDHRELARYLNRIHRIIMATNY